jgi:glucose/mannose transport system permease protein
MATQTVVMPKRRSAGRKRYPWLSISVLILALIFYMLPVYVMVVNGLKDPQEVNLSTMWNLPATLGLGGFGDAWKQLSPNILNSFAMVIPATILSSLLGSINGYFLSKWKFRGSDTLFTIIMFGFFIPYQVILLPMVQFVQTIHLYGSLVGLILMHVIYGIPVTTLIFRNFYAGISNELVEAAVVDGANKYQIFASIMFPLALPAFVVVGIFQFTNIWNDFIFGITIVPNPTAQPVTVALNNLSGNFSVQWNVVMAGAVLAALPTAIVYILLSRYFVRGLLAGSVKG